MRMTAWWLPALSGLALAMMAIPNGVAECGSTGKPAHPAHWEGPSERAQLMLVEEEVAPIVGMWHVTFTAEGNKEGPPDGTPIDNALVTWHSDKTEIMNSGRPPQDGNFCMGVWEEVGHCKYKLNHFAGGNDTTNAPGGIGSPTGPTHLREEVTVSPDGKHYTGTFILDAYDTSFNRTAHIVGVLHGTRITMSTTEDDLM